VNESKWRKRTDDEIRERAEARRADKDAIRAQKRGRIVWHPSMGTCNEGRNQAKRARRAVHFGQPWVNPRAAIAKPTKPVAPAYRVRLPIVRKLKVLTKAPRMRALTPREKSLIKVHSRRRELLARISRRFNLRAA
jgi:hypothetical protein